MHAGDSRVLAFGPVLTETGAYADLAGASAKWWMGKKATSIGADIFVRKSTAVGEGILITSEVIDDETAYTVEVVLNGIDTVAVPPVPSSYVHYYHEVEVTDVTGGVFTVATGKFDLLPALIPPAEQGGSGAMFTDTDTAHTATIAQS